MDSSAPQPQPQAHPSFRSRRSYPFLNQVSVTPLAHSYSIDDENDFEEGPQDYFFPRAEAVDTSTRTSYLSSFSVPGTPGVLSHTPSRSTSRVRHHTRSKSSTPFNLSDSNLQEQNASNPLHHQSRGSRSKRARHQTPDNRDPEWMLRTGIALATSTREEKGQSWLVKRESSTSLVSEAGKYEVDAISQSLRSGISKHSRSGRSTPAASSSRSHAASRRNSRPDLVMTGLEMSTSKRSSDHVSSAPRTRRPIDERRSSISQLPDFIDEQVRAEMRDTIQQVEGGFESAAVSDDDWDSDYSSEEEIDEHELHRLTLERGFGLGSWVDRMVEWTLFGVDDWPLSSTSDPVNHPPPLTAGGLHRAPESSNNGTVNDHDETQSLASDTNSEILVTERAGDRGGWEDAGWLFRTIRRALILV
ncbi:hypothetical protein BJY04DRAFT_110484 [Aspergillus karnatakaensis]|uniref:DUF3984 domain-containing protein n=1 Tax=Aspergillus karnatakaensis TaxID=1810916 RepID=UPI003CCD9350